MGAHGARRLAGMSLGSNAERLVGTSAPRAGGQESTRRPLPDRPPGRGHLSCIHLGRSHRRSVDPRGRPRSRARVRGDGRTAHATARGRRRRLDDPGDRHRGSPS
ncbi:hypothetical protein ACWPOB_16565 [Rhodococcus sp. 2H158]